MSVLIHVPCKPVSWRAHAGSGKKSWNPLFKERKNYQKHISSQYSGPPIEDYVRIDFIFYFAIPASFSKAKAKKAIDQKIFPSRPDTTNLVKFTEDCLKKIVIKDDNIVIVITASKQYSHKDAVSIKITLLENAIC